MAVTDQDMAGFRYVEHKENVALVLKVCSSLDVPRDVALRGMWNAKQDPGAMSECIVDFFGRKILFINGFAANDPESSSLIWKMAIENHPEFTRRLAYEPPHTSGRFGFSAGLLFACFNPRRSAADLRKLEVGSNTSRYHHVGHGRPPWI